MNQNILSYIKSKIGTIILFSVILSAISLGVSYTFESLYKTDVYCYSEVFDNVHNKSVFQSFNTLIGSGNIEEIQALTNMKPEIIEQVNQVDFFEILSEETGCALPGEVGEGDDETTTAVEVGAGTELETEVVE